MDDETLGEPLEPQATPDPMAADDPGPDGGETAPPPMLTAEDHLALLRAPKLAGADGATYADDAPAGSGSTAGDAAAQPASGATNATADPAPATGSTIPLRGAVSPDPVWRWPVEGRYALTPATPPHQGAGGFHARSGGKHQGVDIETDPGTPVLAMGGGTVLRSDHRDPNYGLRVDLQHGGHLSSRYAHLSRVTVRPGDKVTQGQVIGYSGTSGNAYGLPHPHLHFETLQNGQAVNPQPYFPRWNPRAGVMQ